jgi:Domain of unknown function (DUF4105)
VLSVNKFLFLILLTTSTAWAVFAIYFGDSKTSSLQATLAIVFGLLGVLTLLCSWFDFKSKWLLWLYPVLFLLVLSCWLIGVKPSNERNWQIDVAELPYAVMDGGKVTIHNIRNFDYRSEFDYVPAYYSKTYDLEELEGIDLFVVYWAGPAIAHTILSFNFGGKDHLAISIEIRKELNEDYSTIKGFFRQYELMYIVADERDVIRLRTNYRKEPPEAVYIYRIQAKKENIRRLFLEYVRNINELRDSPMFYNTLLDNCTTGIWFNTRVNPGHLPFSWKILLSGYVPGYLYDSKLLDTRLPFEELQRLAYINPVAQAAGQSPDFSRLIRAGDGKLNLQ